MTTVPIPLDAPPYQFQHLISNVNEIFGGSPTPNRPSSRGDRGSVEVCCAQALGSDIYVGCTDGSLLRYAFVDSLGATTEAYQLLNHQALPSGRAIEQITLAPSVEKALVFCDRQIHFFSLPNLEPVQQIKPIRHIITFALDDAQQRKPPPDRRSHQLHQPEPVHVYAIKRNHIAVFTLRDQLRFKKEIPLPNGASIARLSSTYLCVADHETYNIINLESTSLIPLMPLSQTADSAPVKPLITVIGESEFLVLSWTGANTMGVFVTGTGDPVRGTLTWDTHPTALCCEYPYVTALLPDGTVVVHSVETQAICQVIPVSSTFSAATLEKSCAGFIAPGGELKQKLDIVNFPLLEPETPNTSAIEEREVYGTHSTPQAQPPPPNPSATPVQKSRARQSTAGLIAVSTDAVNALVTPTLIQQADVLLEKHKLEETTNLAKEWYKKLSQSHGDSDIQDQADELNYVWQRLGYKCLSETHFEDAGNHLFRGNVDPRLLIRLFPALRGTLLSPSSTSLPVFSGLASQIRSLGTVDAIIVTNLVKNYAPHLQPNTRSAPPTSELRRMLMSDARNMLREYLRKWKNKIMYSGEPVIKEVSQAVDTVLVKLLAEREDTEALYSLVESSGDIVVDDVEDTLIHTGQYNALIKIHRKRNDEGKLLEIWSKLVDGEWTEDAIRDPLGQMMAMLNQSRDRGLVQRWGLWLVKRDPAAGLKLLMSGDTRRGTKADDDGALLAQIEAVSPKTGQQFLEYLVLQKHSNHPNLHTRLAQACLDQLLSLLETEPVLDFFREFALEYSIQNSPNPFLTHLASAADASSPEHEHIRTRCRAALFLQGSALYDVLAIREKLKPWEDVLGFEVAILDGKLGNHNGALRTLVHTLRDTASADAYCALGGCPVPPKVAMSIGERLDLQPWAALIVQGTNRRGGAAKVNGKESLEETRSQLFKVLLEVYMSGGEAMEGHTARLLNSQGGNLDVLDVLSLVPPTWPLRVVSSFLERSLRQAVHKRCEGEILKAVCLCQNLEARDRNYLLVRAQGAVIEEAVEGSQPPLPDESELDEVTAEKKLVVVVAEDVEIRSPDAEKERGRYEHSLSSVEGEVT